MLVLFFRMQVPAKDLILLISLTSLVFLIAPLFLILYVRSYNNKKKKHAEEKIFMERIYEQELLSSRIEVQEQTMQAIAYDLHDNVGQLLSLVSSILGSINIGDPENTREKIAAAHDLTTRSIKELRELAKRMQGLQLMHSGLYEAINTELEYIRKMAYRVNFNTNGNAGPETSQDKDLIIFRLFQELLNNIIKHARATQIDITLEYLNTELKLHVADNGQGFDSAGVVGKKGMGLGNVQRRAAMLNGEVIFNSSPEGTSIIVSIPYSNE